MIRSQWIAAGGRRTAFWTLWAWPGLALALLPKCPACLAGYVALWTGIGLSMPAATGLQRALVLICGAGVLLALWHILRVTRQQRASACGCPARRHDPVANTTETPSE